MKKIIMLLCNLLSLSCLSFAEDRCVNNINDNIKEIDFVVFFTENKFSHSNKIKLYTGKINHEKLKKFLSNYISVSSSGMWWAYTSYYFYHENKIVSAEQIEGISSSDVFLADIKPVKQKYKAFKSLEKYKIFQEKLLEKENIYIIDVDDEVQSQKKNKLYGLKWYEW